MTQWSNDAQKYLDGYLMQVAAIAHANGDDATEITDNLREHVQHDVSHYTDGTVELHHVRSVLATLGTPEEVCSVDPSVPLPADCAVFFSESKVRRGRVAGVIALAAILSFFAGIGVMGLTENPDRTVTTPTNLSTVEQIYNEAEIMSADIDELFEKIKEPEDGRHQFAAMWALILRVHWADEDERDRILTQAIEVAENEDNPFNQRFQSCYVAASFEDPDVIPGLARVLTESKVQRLRGVAACALGHFEDESAKIALERALLNEDDPETREWITRAIKGEFPRSRLPDVADAT